MQLLRTLGALIVLALAACGTAPPPATLDAIPAFPVATVIEPGANAMADAVAEAMRGSVNANLSSEVRLYSLPPATTWEEVRAFYGEALGTGWEPAAELDTANEALSTAGWQRGGAGGEQVLMIGYLPALLDEGPVAIVSLFSR